MMFMLAVAGGIAGCDMVPTVQSNTATAVQKQALVGEIVRFGIKGEVADSSAVSQAFNVTFKMKNRYQALIGGESTEWYQVFQLERTFTPKSTYTVQYRRGKQISAILDLRLSGKFCLTPTDVREAIAPDYRGKGKMAEMIGIFEPPGEKLKNSTMFDFTEDNACLRSVSFWSKS